MHLKRKKLLPAANDLLPNKGFTLLELLVVIAIIGILSAVGLGSYMNSRKKGADARRRADLKEIQNAMEQAYAIDGAYPTTEAGVDALFSDGVMPSPPGSLDTTYIQDISTGSSYAFCATLEVETGNCDAASDTPCADTCADNDSCPVYCVWDLQGS